MKDSSGALYIALLPTHIRIFLTVSKEEKNLLFWRDGAVTKDSLFNQSLFFEKKKKQYFTITLSVWKIIFDSKAKNRFNRLENKFHLNKNSVPTSEWTHDIYIKNSNRLISFNETIVADSDTHAKRRTMRRA